jgi:hypothetical protein
MDKRIAAKRTQSQRNSMQAGCFRLVICRPRRSALSVAIQTKKNEVVGELKYHLHTRSVGWSSKYTINYRFRCVLGQRRQLLPYKRHLANALNTTIATGGSLTLKGDSHMARSGVAHARTQDSIRTQFGLRSLHNEYCGSSFNIQKYVSSTEQLML